MSGAGSSPGGLGDAPSARRQESLAAGPGSDAIRPMRTFDYRRPAGAAAGAGRLEWVDDLERLEALAAPWGELARHQPLPFLTHAWFLSWWKAFHDGRRPAVAVLWRGDRLAGVLPLVGGGQGLRAMANAETPAFAPLARDDEVHAELVAAAARRAGSSLVLVAVPAGAPLERLAHDLRAAGFVTDASAFRTSPIVMTSGTFEAWRKETKPRWRVQLDRLRRKAAREHQLEMELVREPGDLEAELDDGLAVEASGWKGESGTAVRDDPASARFYRELARRFHALGALRLSRMVLDGRTVAFDLCLLHGNRLWLMKTGVDDSARKLAPGLVLHLGVIERCFELGLDGFELLGDDEEWKRKFATAERETRVLRAASWRSMRALPVALRHYGRPAKRLLASGDGRS